jgi:adenine-specific DNA-methyltransferase
MTSALAVFQTLPLKDAARQLLAKLGYKSDRFFVGAGSKPQDFLADFASGHTFDQTKAFVSEWKSADLLFQLTDQELSRESALFAAESVQRGLLKSYVFIAIELKGSDYARGNFSAITRQINRLFPMPVMVIFKHGDRLTIAVINRRRNKTDDSKDVLEKATLIRDITFAQPHRGHLDILASLALPNLVHPQKKPITDFDTLHAAWEQIFNVELLNERFYRELSNWYFWALPQVEFPADLEPDDEKRRATGLIRLLTRLIFCWFLKEKNLIPEKLFHPIDLAKILKGFDPESETSSTYYQAILQNLFFATLNQRMGKDGNGKPYRFFATDEGFQKNRATHDVNNLYRYEALFRDEPDAALAHFADIPFLNGGLFECLDRTEDSTDKKRYLDGFSRNAKKRPRIPDRLFFDSGETADLSTAYGDTKRKAERVTGLITILNRYKFTIVENTPIDQEIALDPELLGKVFENLLASYNEETKTTARKQTGSFYTPRPIVDYMVDESLKAHLTRALVEQARMKEPDARAGLDLLFAYTEKEHAFTPTEVATLIAAIDTLKILDPACGSGAFPMGVLHKLVYLLSKLDRENVEWEKLQIAKAQEISDNEERRRKLAEIASSFVDNNDDYGRKLYLIENCLYGVDIQPIAIQITKLRFFISLVCDQKTNQNKAKNLNIKPLPNLETKFVAANTLIGLPIPEPDLFIRNLIEPIEKQIEQGYHSHFSIQRRDQKIVLQKHIKTLRQKLSNTLLEGLGANKNSDVAKKAQLLADWDAFDPQASADFFDPHWMFGRSLADGFDIVIGNPPYVFARDSAAKGITQAAKDYYYANYSLAEYQVNLYPIFIEAGSRALTKCGVLCFITPNNWLTINTNRKLRQFVLAQSKVSILNFYARVFASADVDAAIVLFQSGTPQSKTESVRLFEWTTEPELIVDAPKAQFLSQPDAIINIEALKSGDTGDLMTKIEKGTRPLKEIASVKCGLGAYGRGDGIPPQTDEMIKSRVYHSKTKVSEEWFKYVEGVDVKRYALGWLREEYLKWGRHLREPRNDWKLFSTPRILVRQIPSPPPYCINACFTTETFLNDRNSMNIIKIAIKPQLVLAVLNSRLMTYWFVHKFGKMQRGIFPQFKINELAIFPMPRSFAPHEESLIASVKRILAAKQTNPAADTSALEREIDQQVYALYGLTPEEIAIVEGTAP